MYMTFSFRVYDMLGQKQESHILLLQQSKVLKKVRSPKAQNLLLFTLFGLNLFYVYCRSFCTFLNSKSWGIITGGKTTAMRKIFKVRLRLKAVNL